MDFLKKLYGSEPDPMKTGDTKSWFLFYKWMVEGETHFDVTENEKHSLYRDLKEGDRLWFEMDGWLLGYVEVIRVMEDPTRDVWEIWYNGEACHKFDKSQMLKIPHPQHVGTIVPEETAVRWLEHCK